MAKVKLAPAVEAIHGHVGNMLFRRCNGQEVVGKVPDRTNVVPTADQLAQQEKFKLAAFYGKTVLADTAKKALYTTAAEERGIQAFALAVADFLNPPTVDQVDLSKYTGKVGDTITVRASDELEISGITVGVRDEGGTLLESGAAIKGTGGMTWTYTATTALGVGASVVIEVHATDLPGNVTTRVQPKT